MPLLDRVDRLLQLDPAECSQGNEPYEIYRAGVRGAIIGGVVLAGGAVLKAAAGLEMGSDLEIAGFLVEGLGDAAIIAGMENLESTREY